MGDYPKQVTKECQNNVVTAATAYAKQLYGDKKPVENKNAVITKRAFGWGRFAYITACALIAFILTSFMVVPPVAEERFQTITAVNCEPIQSVQWYNQQNGTNYLCFNFDGVQDFVGLEEVVKLATSENDGQFAYLWQKELVLYGGQIDTINFYVSPLNIKCKDLNSFDIIDEKIEYKNYTFYYTETLSDSTYITMARFTYQNANYYLKIESANSGVFYAYINQLLGL